MKLRLGFIGLGAMGLSHVQSVRRLCSDTAEVAALCDSNETNLAKAREMVPGAKAFRDARELIGSELDAVFVSTPNFTHAELAVSILGAGKHLFLEKPCGITAAECRRVLEAARASDRRLMLGHELRYSPYFQRVKELVAGGEIGRPQMVWTREWRGPFQQKVGDWIQDDRLSGGCLVDKNCHHFDLMNWWVAARPSRVAAFGGCAVHRRLPDEHQVHDHATVSFEYENGVRGTLQLCMFALDFPHEDLEMGIIGDRGRLMTRLPQLEILHWRSGTGRNEPVVHQVNAKAGEGWGSHLGFDEIHLEFVRCLREGREPLTSVGQCVDGTLLAIAAEEAIKQRRIVEIE